MWKDLNEYESNVNPTTISNVKSRWEMMLNESSFQRAAFFTATLEELENGLKCLKSIWNKDSDHQSSVKGSAWAKVLEISSGIDELFLYCQPVAIDKDAYDIRHEKDLYEHWERYYGTRLKVEVPKFIEAVNKMIKIAHEYLKEAGKFILGYVDNLPSNLYRHYEIARDLFSIESEEIAAFSALRGLEATLREIFVTQKVKLEYMRKKGNPSTSLLAEMDLHDIIEAGRKLTWADKDLPILNKERAALLQYLRVNRNVIAHSKTEFSMTEGISTYRNIASLAAQYASELWKDSQNGLRRIKDTKIKKDW